MNGTKDAQVALWFATAKHADQLYGQQPYTFHLEAAVNELVDHILPLPALRFYDHEVIVCATFLHDVIEDTETSLNDLNDLFVPQIGELVVAVTDGPGKNRRERKKGVYEAIRRVGPAALAVKLADRLANAKVAGLAKDPTSAMLQMYRKEQPEFEDHLRPYAGVDAQALYGFGPAFKLIRAYLGLDPNGGVYGP